MSVKVKRLNKAAVILFVITELFLLIGVIASIIGVTSLSPKEGCAPDVKQLLIGITYRLISDIGASVFLVIGLIIQYLLTEKYDYYAKTNYYLQWIIIIFLILNFSCHLQWIIAIFLILNFSLIYVYSLIHAILIVYIFYHLLRKRSLYLKSYKTI